MRVISGSAKGRKLHTPKGNEIRPTLDRVKEALFNIIGTRVEDAYILDVFAGTGSLGIEALSRGARYAVFVDSKREAIELTKKNLETTGLSERATVYAVDAEKAVKILAKDGIKADLIFLDPPYRISVSFLDAVMKNLASHVLKTDGWLVLEYATKGEPQKIEDLNIASTRVYGDTSIAIYEKKGYE